MKPLGRDGPKAKDGEVNPLDPMNLTKQQIDDMRTSLGHGTQPFTKEAIESLCALAVRGLTRPEANAIEERLTYWHEKDLRNGWPTIGYCCGKCVMRSPKNPLQAAVGCRDPFQINCECHIEIRRTVKRYMEWEYEYMLQRLLTGVRETNHESDHQAQAHP